MITVTVYRVDFYDIQNDTMQRSRRWFTRAGADRVNGILDETTATEIDETSLERGEQWTLRDFDPHATRGLQSQVR
jgi:hypothetical protein